MYVLALSDYKIFKACCCRGLQTRPPIRQTILFLIFMAINLIRHHQQAALQVGIVNTGAIA